MGSILGMGNLPFSAEHSISKLIILSGAIVEYCPSKGNYCTFEKSNTSISIYDVECLLFFLIE
jgi:hypothetical protein